MRIVPDRCTLPNFYVKFLQRPINVQIQSFLIKNDTCVTVMLSPLPRNQLYLTRFHINIFLLFPLAPCLFDPPPPPPPPLYQKVLCYVVIHLWRYFKLNDSSSHIPCQNHLGGVVRARVCVLVSGRERPHLFSPCCGLLFSYPDCRSPPPHSLLPTPFKICVVI